jgi:hypothetical protein
MGRTKIIDARKLVDFIQRTDSFELIESNHCQYSNHIAALFTDIVLQAGLNYKTVVTPRVVRVLHNYPHCYTVQSFHALIQTEGLENIVAWKHEIKINRILDLVDFCLSNEINTSTQLKEFLIDPHNKSSFLNIKGIGNKTYDYLLKLLNVDNVAVDRHIYSFLEKAEIHANDYHYIKSIVEYAADLLNISRRNIDYSIWYYMAYEEKKSAPQSVLEFSY